MDDAKAISAQIERILTGRHQRALVDAAVRAYEDGVARLRAAGVGLQRTPETSAREIVEAVRLLQHSPVTAGNGGPPSAGDRLHFNRFWEREPKDAGAAARRRLCEELPRLYQTLLLHRNRAAHPGTGTPAALRSLCGTIGLIIEHAGGGWISAPDLASIKAAIGHAERTAAGAGPPPTKAETRNAFDKAAVRLAKRLKTPPGAGIFEPRIVDACLEKPGRGPDWRLTDWLKAAEVRATAARHPAAFGQQAAEPEVLDWMMARYRSTEV